MLLAENALPALESTPIEQQGPLGDPTGALPLYRRALDSSERMLGKEHPDTVRSLNNLTKCMIELGDAAGALPLSRRALDSSERVLGREHPFTFVSANNLAGCLRALGGR
jgi:hypothetical protein